MRACIYAMSRPDNIAAPETALEPERVPADMTDEVRCPSWARQRDPDDWMFGHTLGEEAADNPPDEETQKAIDDMYNDLGEFRGDLRQQGRELHDVQNDIGALREELASQRQMVLHLRGELNSMSMAFERILLTYNKTA